ncbi:MAG: hypothetical protein ACYSUD_15715 [Planctomycetota bacterium]|jgi:translation elongation factor EF-Ts
MVEISAAMVMELRKISGQGMMDCKKALQETDGDVQQAMALLRKKGPGETHPKAWSCTRALTTARQRLWRRFAAKPIL